MRSVYQWIALVLVGSGVSWADEPPQANSGSAERVAEAASVDPATMEAMWQALAQVGPEHKMLHEMAGEWDTINKDYMMKPGEVLEWKGTSTFKPILGGRFMQHNHQAMLDGKKFEGLGISGYDNAQKKFIGVWFDSMGTGMLPMKGNYNEKTQTVVEQGVYQLPNSKMRFRMRTKKINDDKYRTTILVKTSPEADEVKSMEIVYTRVEP